MQTDLQKFTRKSAIFLIPFLIFFSFPTLVLLLCGELTPIEKIVRKQQVAEDPYLLGLAYSNPAKYFKLKSVLARRPEIITLGTSRVLQFRSRFFKAPDKFYNAGAGAETIKQFRHFLNKIPPGQEPKIIIMGLEQYFFNPKMDNLGLDFLPEDEDALERKYTPHLIWMEPLQYTRICLKVYKDYFQKKFSLNDLFIAKNANAGGTKRIGLTALINQTGFRNDGSYYYGQIMNNADAENSQEHRYSEFFERIVSGIVCYQNISTAALNELEIFLQQCKIRDIYVIGLIPPCGHTIYTKMQSQSEKFAATFKLASTLRTIFKKYGFGFQNYPDIKMVGSTDRQTIDGWHGTEKAYLRLFLLMLEHDSKLKGYADIKFLKQMLKQD